MKLPDLQPDVIRSVDNSTLDEGIAEESFSQSTQDKFKQLDKTRHLKKELNNAFYSSIFEITQASFDKSIIALGNKEQVEFDYHCYILVHHKNMLNTRIDLLI
jgi:hypothetical protein